MPNDRTSTLSPARATLNPVFLALAALLALVILFFVVSFTPPAPLGDVQSPTITFFLVTPGQEKNTITFGAQDATPPISFLLARSTNALTIEAFTREDFDHPPSDVTMLSPASSPHVDDGLLAGQAYYYVLRACDAVKPVSNCALSKVESATPTPASGGGNEEEIRIVRDTWGVGNVFADTDEGAFFGMGYVTAQDRMYQMEFIRMLMKGRVSELVGDHGDSIESDIQLRHLQYEAAAQARYPNLDAETRGFLDAYAKGVNQYLQEATASGTLLPLFGNDYTIEPWSPVDSLLAWDYMTYPSPGPEELAVLRKYEARLSAGDTPTQAAQAVRPRLFVDNSAETVSQQDAQANGWYSKAVAYAAQHPIFGGIAPQYVDTSNHFSHGWAVSGSKTTDGKAKLVGDPKLLLTEPAYWHETHVVGKTFNARGITVPGSLGYFVGFNSNVAWTQTASAADYGDLFRLKMIGSNQYEYTDSAGKQTYTLTSSTQQIKVRNGTSRSVTVRSSVLGPIVTPLLDSTKSGEEFAYVAVPLVDQDIHTVQALIGMMRARTTNEYTSALAKWRTPIVNNIFASSQGDVGYWHLAAVPVRSSFLLAGAMVQDGSDAKYQWVEFLPYDLRPHVVNPSEGYVFSGNNLPAGTWYPIASAIGFAGGDTSRSARVRELLSQHVGKFSAADVFDMQQDVVSPSNRDLVRAALQCRDMMGSVCARQLSRETRDALDLLESWYDDGAHLDSSEPYYYLAHHMDTSFRPGTAGVLTDTYGAGESGLMAYLKNIHSQLDANPSLQLTVDDAEFYNSVFTSAMTESLAFDPAPSNWAGKIASNVQGSPARMQLNYFNTLFERWGSLDTRYDKVYGPLPAPHIGTLFSNPAQIYTQLVDFANIDATQAITPVGVSENPQGHFNDQADEWMKGHLRPAPLSEAAVDVLAESVQTLTFAP